MTNQINDHDFRVCLKCGIPPPNPDNPAAEYFFQKPKVYSDREFSPVHDGIFYFQNIDF